MPGNRWIFVSRRSRTKSNVGGRVLIEHPWSSDMWHYSPMAKVTKNMFKCRVDLCAYGLVDDAQTPILKPTAIMVSHADMKDLAHTCPGHATHRVVAGKCKDGEKCQL